MVLSYDTSDDRFGAYAKRQQQAALDKYQAPANTWDKLQNLHNQAVAGQLDASGEKDYKATRRLWNREHKNTPVGIMASGVNLDQNPFGAQDLYHDMSAHLFHDKPKLYDRMYPWSPNKWSRAVGELAGNTMWGQMIKGIAGDREKKVPANVLAMRERFPGVEAFDSGITKLVPDDIKIEEINALNEIANSGEGIFDGGRGDLSPDFDYEEDREGRELSEKIAFLQAINPNVDYNKVAIDMPELIDSLYEQELAKQAQMEEFMHGNIGALNPLQPD